MDNLTRSFSNFNQSVEKNYPIIPGEIGISLGGSRITEVPGRGQFVYVRLRSNQSEIVQVFNGKVFPGYGLPVLVKWNNNRYEIIGVDVQRYQQWVADNPHIAKHGATHSMDKENDRIGTDPVWVYPYQFMPSLVSPFPQSGIQNVYINPLMVQYGGDWKYIGNTGTSNLATYKPTSGSSIVLISLDVTSGNPYLYSTTGTYIPLSTTGTSDLLSYLPSLDLGRYIPLSFVLLTSGTSGITWNNLYDVRQFFTPPSTGSSYLSVNSSYPINSINVTSGANIIISGSSSFWEILGGSSGGGTFYPSFIIDGSLETGTSQAQPYLVTDDFTSDYTYLYLENLGTTGTTKVDLLKNGVSIFTGGYTLQIPYNSTGSWVRAVPYHSSFILGDILALSIKEKATGAGNLLSIIAPTPSSGGSSTLSVKGQGQSPISNVSTLTFSSGTVTNLGSGEVLVQIPRAGMFYISELLITGSAVTTISITDIPQTYRHLKLEVAGRGSATTTAQVRLSFNGDTGTSSYSFDRWNRFGSTNSNAVGYIEAGDIVMNTAPVGAMSSFVVDILDYTRGSYKNVLSVMSSAITTGTISMTPQLGSGIYKKINPVTSMTLTPHTGQFISGTIVSLYGMA